MPPTEPTDKTPADNTVMYPTSKLAIASLVLGVLTIWPFRIFTAIPAIICGHLALSKIKASNGLLSGKGFAITGMVIGYLDILLLVASVIILSILAHQLKESFELLKPQLQSAQASQ